MRVLSFTEVEGLHAPKKNTVAGYYNEDTEQHHTACPLWTNGAAQRTGDLGRQGHIEAVRAGPLTCKILGEGFGDTNAPKRLLMSLLKEEHQSRPQIRGADTATTPAKTAGQPRALTHVRLGCAIRCCGIGLTERPQSTVSARSGFAEGPRHRDSCGDFSYSLSCSCVSFSTAITFSPFTLDKAVLSSSPS
jgi:hypothetical protein